MAAKNFIFLLLALQTFINPSIQKTKEDYSIDRANEYIEQNRNTVIQTYRLKYHAMAPIGWINDPNGFSMYQGEYHLFYQYNPYSAVWDTMHWGHAKSSDLVKWEDLPVALAPDQEYDSGGIFSGSAIEKDGKLYVMYTCVSNDLQQQCIAVSEDGVTFEKVPENPVLTARDLPENALASDFRDPKVFERNGTYYVVLASKTVNETGQVLLYQSPDLIQWSLKSILLEGTADQGIMWECPDLFELDGKDLLVLSPIQIPRSGNEYWNLDSVVAFVGSVNWETGKLNVEYQKELDHGLDFYATQSLLDHENRRIVIAWMNMWGRSWPTNTLNHKWTGAMTLPRQLSFVDDVLIQTPIDGIQNYVSSSPVYEDISITNATYTLSAVVGEVGILEVIANVSQANFFKILLRYNDVESTELSYNPQYGDVTLNREFSGIEITGEENPAVTKRVVNVALLSNDLIKFKVFLDQSSVEVFINDGVESMTSTIYPTEYADIIQFIADGTVYFEKIQWSNLSL